MVFSSFKKWFKQLIFWLGGVTLLSGCAAAYLFQDRRIGYQLVEGGELLASNSPSFRRENFPPLRKDEQGIHIDGDFTIKNRSSKETYTVETDKVVFVLAGREKTMTCLPSTNSLSPGHQTELSCSIRFAPGDYPEMLKRDENAALSIPFSSPSKKGKLAFTYRLRREDFSK